MSILFQQDFDNIHVSFYRNMKSHVVEKMIISRVMRGICSDYYKDVVHGLLNRQENTVFPNIYRDVIKNEIKEDGNCLKNLWSNWLKAVLNSGKVYYSIMYCLLCGGFNRSFMKHIRCLGYASIVRYS